MFQTSGCKITNNHSITQTFYAFFFAGTAFYCNFVAETKLLNAKTL